MKQKKYKTSTNIRLQLRNMRQNMNLSAENVSVELCKSKAWLGQIERGKLLSIKRDDLEKLLLIYIKCNGNKDMYDNVLKELEIEIESDVKLMFEWSKELCKKIKDANCLEPKELQMVEIALRLYECHEEILNENLGLDIISGKETNIFQLEYAIHRNSSKERS